MPENRIMNARTQEKLAARTCERHGGCWAIIRTVIASQANMDAGGRSVHRIAQASNVSLIFGQKNRYTTRKGAARENE
jgi:hypothetical protein